MRAAAAAAAEHAGTAAAAKRAGALLALFTEQVTVTGHPISGPVSDDTFLGPPSKNACGRATKRHREEPSPPAARPKRRDDRTSSLITK